MPVVMNIIAIIVAMMLFATLYPAGSPNLAIPGIALPYLIAVTSMRRTPGETVSGAVRAVFSREQRILNTMTLPAAAVLSALIGAGAIISANHLLRAA